MTKMLAGSRANDCPKINLEERRKNKKPFLRKRKGEYNAYEIKAKQRTEKYKKNVVECSLRYFFYFDSK